MDQEPGRKIENGESRRDFLKTAAAVGMTAAALTGGKAEANYMPTTAEGMARLKGANDRIRIGHIGVGHQGGLHLTLLMANKAAWNIEYVAICDIYSKNRTEKAKTAGLQESQTHIDYRKMLEKGKDIDACWITTPEHWHGQMVMDAMQAGKDVYLEKPLCKGVEEALKVQKVALSTKRVLQVGSQGCSDPTYKRISELIASGKYGPVVWAQGSYCRNSKDGEWNSYVLEDEANAESTHWPMFEEPCKTKHAFDKQRFFRWRKYWDYSAGIQGDLFPHVLHPFLIAVGKPEFPRRVVALGDLLLQKDREVPDTVHMLIEYPSNYTVVLSGSTVNDKGYTPTIRTNKASIEFAMFGGGHIHVQPQNDYADDVDELNEDVKGAGEEIDKHQLNFLECVRDRTKTPNCGIDLATKVQVAISMGEMSYREQREVKFDVEKMSLV